VDEVETPDVRRRGAEYGHYDGAARHGQYDVAARDGHYDGAARDGRYDGAAAREAIHAAFVQAMTSADAVTAMAAVQDGDALVPALTRFADTYPEIVGTLAVDVADITHDEPGRALVSFQLGAPGYGELPLQGEAVRVDGTWKVAHSTIAGMLGAAGFAPEP
jgi:hypothetical protein